MWMQPLQLLLVFAGVDKPIELGMKTEVEQHAHRERRRAQIAGRDGGGTFARIRDIGVL
jgi:hypothetical protein